MSEYNDFSILFIQITHKITERNAFLLFFFSHGRIRGKLGSFAMLSRNIGMLCCFIVGSSVDYQDIPYAFVLIPIVAGIIFFTLPNTPQFYLQRNQHQVKKTFTFDGRQEPDEFINRIVFCRKLKMP